MQVIFDNIIFSLQKAGGISVVWYELLSRVLCRKEMDVAFIEYDNADQNLFRRNLNLKSDAIRWHRKKYLRAARYLDVRIKEKDPFIFHSSYYRLCADANAINITTVHDFTYELFKKGIRKKIHCWQKHRSIRKADHIVCISHNTKKDLLYFLPDVDEKKLHVIHNGVSADFKPLDLTDGLMEPLPPYILFIGSREKYKNFRLAVEAVANTEFNLLIVGAEMNREEIALINASMGMDRIVHKQGIANEELNVLYNHAFCLLYPSSYEGFGIPVLEAQKSGCPVIAFNGSSITEIIGDTPLLLQDLSVGEVIDKINILRDTRRRSEIIGKGYDNINRFSWDTMGEKMIALYDEIIQGKG